MNKAPNKLGAFFIFNSMKIFFETVLDEVYKNIDLEKTYFVIPNQRSKIFLKKEILKKISSASISPQIYSIDDFIEKIADIKESPRINQLFYLHESYMMVSSKKDFESYALFRNWANTLLNDINDVDMGMADASVYKDLYEIHKLEAITNQETEKKLAFWGMIPKIVENFKSRLIENNLASKGLCHVYAKENIEIFSDSNKEYSFIFLGLNSLSNTEQYVINYVLENNKAEIFWDCDDSFIENPEHEAGYFFRKYISDWDYFKTKKFKWSKKLISSRKNISIYETTKQIAQVKTAANLIHEISKKKSKDKTAIILPNQELLMPLISSLPESIEKLSISISNSVINMQLSKFATNFFEMYSRKKSNSFYYKDILNTLSNSYLLRSNPTKTDLYESIKSNIINKNMVYVSSKYLQEILNNDVSQKLFNCTELTILDTLYDYIDIFESNINESVFIEQTTKIKNTLQIIKNFNSKYKFTISFNSLKDFFNDMIKNQSISFYGDPTHSFHVMGLLESRGMDFHNVIICSVNEGILPSNNFHGSLIPFDLRKKYNLTTIIEDDARTSYDFYHLLLRASNIHLIYNSVSEGVDTGEKSRYIQQLELLENKNHNINQIISHYPFSSTQNIPEVFEKTEALISRLKEIAEIGFSPSSLNRYIDNPINFFDECVIGVKSNEEVNEFPEARGIGIIFHNTMEAIYKPFTEIEVDVKKLKISLKKIDKLLDYEFIQEYGKNYDRGKNMIIYKVLKNTIKKLIQTDIDKINKGIKLKIIDIESKLEIDLVTEKTKIKYKLKGRVDRIQSENGDIKIIDYKTGSFESYKLSFGSYQDLIDKKKKEAFQLLCYCLMYGHNNKKSQKLNAGIISFKNLNSGLISLKKSKTENYNQEELDKFKTVLDNVIEEIFDANLSFSEN